jgi:hypothetical protein
LAASLSDGITLLMAIVTPESMYSIQYDPAGELQLVARASCLVVDDPHEFIDDYDTLGPIHIRSGLEPRDVVTFLQFSPDGLDQEMLPEDPVGYLVSVVDDNPEGSGIIVSGLHLERSPKTWISPRIEAVWGLLAGSGYEPGAEFELHALGAFLKTRRR